MGTLELSAESKLLREELDKAKQEYAKTYAAYEEMTSHERESLYILYLNLIGQAEYDNYKLSIEVKAIRMKVEYAQMALNRNEAPDIKKIEKNVNSMLDDFREELEAKEKALKTAKKAQLIETSVFNELKQLYRLLVKRLHPDLHPEQESWKMDLFIMAQTAYKTQDLHKLREILLKLETEDKDIVIDNYDEIRKYIDRLNASTENMKSRMSVLNGEFPYKFRSKLHDRNWVAKRKDELAEEYEQLEKERDKYTERWELIKEVRWEK